VKLARVPLDSRQHFALLARAGAVGVLDQELGVTEHHVQRLTQVVGERRQDLRRSTVELAAVPVASLPQRDCRERRGVPGETDVLEPERSTDPWAELHHEHGVDGDDRKRQHAVLVHGVTEHRTPLGEHPARDRVVERDERYAVGATRRDVAGGDGRDANARRTEHDGGALAETIRERGVVEPAHQQAFLDLEQLLEARRVDWKDRFGTHGWPNEEATVSRGAGTLTSRLFEGQARSGDGWPVRAGCDRMRRSDVVASAVSLVLKALRPRPAAVSSESAIVIAGLTHRYGERTALHGVDLDVGRGEIFGVLGPNGGGKTTLFKVLATLVAPQEGRVTVFDEDVGRHPERVRRRLGVVFQHPALDGKLTVLENLVCHGALYGLGGAESRTRAARLLERLGLTERADDYVETLSGGLARRVELAKGLLHEPSLVLLDEPSTGLDPGARRDFFSYLVHLRDHEGLTVVLTTHYMEEAERCDRIGFIHQGRVVAIGRPSELKAEIGGDVVVVDAADAERLRGRIADRFECVPRVVDGVLRIEIPRGHEFVRDVVEAFPADIRSVTFGKPTLEDVFVHLTGERFFSDGSGQE
jgi:ABC-2 type transport system ATP-binding protein